ncbi:hypothetical protein LL972_06800 [Xanthomonas campestris pv. asclepiadis]|uniref:hypothetical protein n=1 Tax=Xanthomonas campestris TaxID=339 RepID=UPI001E3906CB|nr:hypothetical protein [Xanthomonas campestris]MCC4615714.1 hypothetical protein [Xanthomonas campestris pv. asclepiadis]
MVGEFGCKQSMVCVGRITVRSIGFPAQVEQQAAARQSNLQTFQRLKAKLATATRGFSTDHRPTSWCGVLAGCGTLGGMDAAEEPPWTDSRRVPQVVRAPRARLPKLFELCMVFT